MGSMNWDLISTTEVWMTVLVVRQQSLLFSIVLETKLSLVCKIFKNLYLFNWFCRWMPCRWIPNYLIFSRGIKRGKLGKMGIPKFYCWKIGPRLLYSIILCHDTAGSLLLVYPLKNIHILIMVTWISLSCSCYLTEFWSQTWGQRCIFLMELLLS